MKKHPADRRQRIMNAAIRFFAKKGFFNTRMEDIARSAGIAKGTVYLYFKDKPSLYVGIIDYQFQNAIATLRQIRDEPGSASKKLVAVAQAWQAMMMRFRFDYHLSVFNNISLTNIFLRKFHQQALIRIHDLQQMLAEIIRQGINQGEFGSVDPYIAAHCFLNMIQGAFTAHRFLPGIKNAEQGMFEIFLSGLKKS